MNNMKKKIVIFIFIVVLFSLNFVTAGCNNENKIDRYIELLKANSFTLDIIINIPVLGDKNYLYKKEKNKIYYNDNGDVTFEESLDYGYNLYDYKDGEWFKIFSKAPFLKYNINYVDEKISDNDFTKEGGIYKLNLIKYYDLFESNDFKDLFLRFESNNECVITVDYKIKNDLYWKITAKIYNVKITSVVIPLA
jgi:hypothetical protein